MHQPFHGLHFNPLLGQQLLHEFIVTCRQRVNRLTAHIACLHAQGGSDVTDKQVQIQRDVGVGGVSHLLEEVGGERQLTDGIIAALDHHDVVQTLAACLNHGKAFGIAEHGAVFTHGDDIQCRGLLGSLLHQVTVTTGERVGIHHDGSSAVRAVTAHAAQVVGITADASHTVLHQNGLGCRSDNLETHALKHGAVIGLGIDLNRVGTLLMCHANEAGNQLVAQTGLTGSLAHGYALDNVALQAPTGNDVAIVIGDGGIVVHVLKTQTAVGKETLHPRPVGLERKRHVADFKVIVHSPLSTAGCGPSTPLGCGCGCACTSVPRGRTTGSGVLLRLPSVGRWECRRCP